MATKSRPRAGTADEGVDVAVINEAIVNNDFNAAVRETVWNEIYQNYECALCDFASLKKARTLGHVRTAHGAVAATGRRAAARAAKAAKSGGLVNHRGEPISSADLEETEE